MLPWASAIPSLHQLDAASVDDSGIVASPGPLDDTDVEKQEQDEDDDGDHKGTAHEIVLESHESQQEYAGGKILGDRQICLAHHASVVGDHHLPHYVPHAQGSGELVARQTDVVDEIGLGIGILRQVDLEILLDGQGCLGLADTRHGYLSRFQGIPRQKNGGVGVGTIGPGQQAVGIDVGGDQFPRGHVLAPHDDAEIGGAAPLTDRDHTPASLVGHTRVHAAAVAVEVILTAVRNEGIAVGEGALTCDIGGGKGIDPLGGQLHEQLVPVGLTGDDGEIPRGGTHLGIVNARGVGVAGVRRAQAEGLGVHLLHEGGHRIGDQNGGHMGGVVVAARHGGVEDVLDLQLFTHGQGGNHFASLHTRQHGGGDGDLLLQPSLQGAAEQQPRHDLYRGGGVDVGIRFLFVEGDVVFQIDQKHHAYVSALGRGFRLDRRRGQSCEGEDQKQG